MLHGVCSPFIETTPIIGRAIAASSSPIARMKARCGVRCSPSRVMSERSFLIGAATALTRPAKTGRGKVRRPAPSPRERGEGRGEGQPRVAYFAYLPVSCLVKSG